MAKHEKKPLVTKGRRKPGYLHASLSWLPDWTNKDAYPNPETTSSQQWAWEFLRRNPVYRNLREDFLDRHKPSQKLLNEAKQLIAVRNSDGTLVVEGSNPELDIFREFIATCNSMFGIMHFPPATSEKSPLLKFEIVRIFHNTEGIEALDKDEVSGKDVLCILNLDYPLSEQLEYLKVNLSQANATPKFRARRKRDNLYQDYLRILDAHELDIPLEEISDVLKKGGSAQSEEYRGKKRIHYNLKIAKKFRNKDFRYLHLKTEK